MNQRAELLLLCGAALAVSVSPAPARWAPADSTGIVAPGAHLEHLFDGGEFTEGPAVAPDGTVFFSDLTFSGERPWHGGHLWRYLPDSRRAVIYRSPSNMSNGLAFDERGRMIVAEGDGSGARRVVRTDIATGKTEILAARFGGEPLNSPNDLVLDDRGRIFFTDPRYGDASSVRQPVNGVYRLDPDGNLALLIRDISMPNGITLSPDQSTLYVGCFDESDTTGEGERMAIFACDLGPDGSTGNLRKLVSYGMRGGPDGLTVDSEGNIYAAVRDEARPGVAIYNRQGTEIGFISLPEIPSNVAFDRPPHADRLYVTAGGGLYRITLTKRGFHLPVAQPAKMP